METISDFLKITAIANMSIGNMIMDIIGMVFIYLAIKKHYEPLLLIPIGFGILIGNVPVIMVAGKEMTYVSVSQAISEGSNDYSVMYYLFFGVSREIYPALIFMGIGALTDFSFLISRPKLFLLGAAAQFGIFLTFFIALGMGFIPKEAGAIGIIGGADGPTAIFTSSILAPHLLAPIAMAAYSYMALVPIIQPPIMRLLTTRRERTIRMRPMRPVSRREKILFPIGAFLICAIIAPASAVLTGCFFIGNLFKESGVTDRLAKTASTSFVDIVTILVGVCVGCSATAETFLKASTLKIVVLGAFSFALATASGVIFAKLMNLFSKNKINPLIGAAGVSAVPMAARVAQQVAQREDPNTNMLMHAMGPNLAGVIGSAMAAGILLSILS